MRQWLVKRKNDEVVVTIFRNKSDNTYSFINLSKEHICPCRFSSIEEAIQDMEIQVKKGNIINYKEIKKGENNEGKIKDVTHNTQ